MTASSHARMRMVAAAAVTAGASGPLTRASVALSRSCYCPDGDEAGLVAVVMLRP